MFADNNTDAIFITKSENVIYILGFTIESDTFIVIPKKNSLHGEGKIKVFLNALEVDEAMEKIDCDKGLANEVEILPIPPGQSRYIEKTIKAYNFKKVGFEDDYISIKKFQEWKEIYDNIQFIKFSNVISDARLIKTKEELKRMEKAAKLGDIGFKAILEIIREGMNEKELAAEAEYAMRKAGSDGTSFNTIVASGKQSAFPHAKTSDNPIDDGDLIIVDIGAKYNGYCSDMTRTFIFGKVDPKKAKLLNLVNDGQKFALDNVKSETKCSELDKVVRDFFLTQSKEWGTRFIHSLGHGIGIDIHENPYLSPVSQEVLRENMVVTIEPGLYIPGMGGARTEDQIVITKDGYISLTHSQKCFY